MISVPKRMDSLRIGIPAALFGYWFLKSLWQQRGLPNLDKRAVFISGCDSGFGRRAAFALAKKGLLVFAGCLTEKGKESIELEAKELKLKGKIVGVIVDVTNDQSVIEAAEFVRRNLTDGIQLWTVLNNAGVFSCFGPTDWCSMEEFKSAMDINFFGAVRVTKAFLPLLKESKGRLGATTSVAGRAGVPFGAPYAAAKFALGGFMESISEEIAVYGIECAIFEPGVFRTALIGEKAMNDRVEGVWERMSEQLREEYGEEYKKKFLKGWHGIMNKFGSTNLDNVVDSYVHFVTSRRPQFRYQCGWDSKYFWGPLSLLPTHWKSAIMKSKQPLVPKALC